MKIVKNKQPKTWRKVRLGEFAEVNPPVRLQRGKEYPFLDMADVIPLSRMTNWQKRKVFNGSGARFENGDTLFARITPCLENGKITQARELKTLAFGSTEFYVLRGKQGISDSDFISYLSRAYKIRKLAEGSMVGASGRQRVERVAFENIEVEVPEDINTQKRIAEVLSAFDDKIEVNNKISKNLEAMAQAIFKEWFANFRFPGHEKVKMVNSELGKIPEGWKVKNFEDIMDFLNGEYIPQSQYDSKGNYLIYGSNTIMGRSNKYLYKGPIIILAKIGSYCGAIRYSHFPCWINNNAGGIKGKKEIPTSFIYYLLRKFNFNQVKEGTGQPFISMKGLKIQKGILPPQKLLDLFNKNIDNIKNYIANNEKENQKLAAFRDLLLPKLMSGEIRI